MCQHQKFYQVEQQIATICLSGVSGVCLGSCRGVLAKE